MKTVAGIFATREDAVRAAARLESLGIACEDVTVLSPGTPRLVDRVPTDEGEQPGTGTAIGAVVGGATGAATGVPIGAAVATLLVPGIGPIIASGIIGAALFGAAGAAIGNRLEDRLEQGLPRDEIFVYEDALRRGQSVVIALVRDDDRADETRRVFEAEGAHSIDRAREDWWIGIRDTERVGFAAGEEQSFRRGFEAALARDVRGRGFDDEWESLARRYPDVARGPAFRRGWERGQAYHRRLVDERDDRPDLRETA